MNTEGHAERRQTNRNAKAETNLGKQRVNTEWSPFMEAASYDLCSAGGVETTLYKDILLYQGTFRPSTNDETQEILSVSESNSNIHSRVPTTTDRKQ